MSERILAKLGEPYVLSGHLHHSTCSIGVTLFGRAPWTVSELLKQADLAMYQAKNAGRNTVCFFDPEMQAVVDGQRGAGHRPAPGLARGPVPASTTSRRWAPTAA